MSIRRTLFGIALSAGVLSFTGLAFADKPADDFLNPQDPGPRLSFMTLIGPGFRAIYDHRYQLEQDVTELRTQIMGDLVFPYSELSAHVDLRMFLFSVGASAGYHNEWHVLQFNPNYTEGAPPPTTINGAGYALGRDLAGQRQALTQSPDGTWQNTGPFGYTDLTREARRVKDQNADVQTARWAWYEGRIQFLWPAQNFMGVSTAAMRNEDRPDVSFDWANATVLNGGWHLRWETYAFFRDPNIGFIGPAIRVMNVPRNRLQATLTADIDNAGAQVTAARGSACQPVPTELGQNLCKEVRETDIHYGFIGGFRPNWVGSSDLFLTRVYMTFGLDDDLFGTHIFNLPLNLLFAYQVDVSL